MGLCTPALGHASGRGIRRAVIHSTRFLALVVMPVMAYNIGHAYQSLRNYFENMPVWGLQQSAATVSVDSR